MRKSHRVGDSDAYDANSQPVDGCHFSVQEFHLPGWDSVRDQNSNVRCVVAIAVCTVETGCSHQTKSSGRVRVPTEVPDVSDCRLQRANVREIVEVKVQRCAGTCKHRQF